MAAMKGRSNTLAGGFDRSAPHTCIHDALAPNIITTRWLLSPTRSTHRRTPQGQVNIASTRQLKLVAIAAAQHCVVSCQTPSGTHCIIYIESILRRIYAGKCRTAAMHHTWERASRGCVAIAPIRLCWRRWCSSLAHPCASSVMSFRRRKLLIRWLCPDVQSQ